MKKYLQTLRRRLFGNWTNRTGRVTGSWMEYLVLKVNLHFRTICSVSEGSCRLYTDIIQNFYWLFANVTKQSLPKQLLLLLYSLCVKCIEKCVCLDRFKLTFTEIIPSNGKMLFPCTFRNLGFLLSFPHKLVEHQFKPPLKKFANFYFG